MDIDLTLPFVVLVIGAGFLISTSNRMKRRRFIKQLRLLHKTNYRLAYELYLASPYWQEKRVICFKRFNYKCALCGSPHRLQAHHITYKNLFDEKPGDLVALCADCHARAPKSAGLYKGLDV